jgi:hypothetical protein
VVSDGEQTPEVYWHLRPGGWSFDADAATLRSEYDHDVQVTIDVASGADLQAEVYDGEEDPINGWYSGHIGVKHPAAAMMVSRTGACPLSFETLIQPARGEAPAARVERMAREGTAVSVAINSVGETNIAGFSPAGEDELAVGDFTTDAECLWLDSADDPRQIIACGVSSLQHGGQTILECDQAIGGVLLRREGDGFRVSLADAPEHIGSDFPLELA